MASVTYVPYFAINDIKHLETHTILKRSEAEFV